MAWLRRPTRNYYIRNAVDTKIGQRLIDTAEATRAANACSRVSILRNIACDVDLSTTRQAEALACKLDCGDNPPPVIAACAVLMRNERICTNVEVWCLSDIKPGPVVTAALASHRALLAPAELNVLGLKHFRRALRADLDHFRGAQLASLPIIVVRPPPQREADAK